MKPELSICVTINNRSKVDYQGDFLYLFPNCIDSIVNAISDMPEVEIVIADWNSSDWRLNDWIHERLKGLKYTIVFQSGAFSRGAGRNVAADNAKSNVLFFLDADMLITHEVITTGLRKVREGIAYFPQCFYFLDKAHSRGFWYTGKGNCMITRDWYLQAGKWPCPPGYRKEHDEDWRFYQLIGDRVTVHSEKQEGLFHQFHPGRSVDIITRRQRNLIVNTSDLDK